MNPHEFRKGSVYYYDNRRDVPRKVIYKHETINHFIFEAADDGTPLRLNILEAAEKIRQL